MALGWLSYASDLGTDHDPGPKAGSLFSREPASPSPSAPLAHVFLSSLSQINKKHLWKRNKQTHKEEKSPMQKNFKQFVQTLHRQVHEHSFPLLSVEYT